MAYKYDPILCMNIPVEKSKTKDADKYTEKAIELLKQGKTKNEVIFALQRMGLTPTDASQRLGKALVETGFKYNDSISSIDEAIKACDTNDKKVVRDGMFSKTFGEVTKGAEYKMKHGLSELGKITDPKQFEQVNQTYANELNKSLERLMTTYNVASQDYQNERNNIIDLINQFNKQSIQMYRKLIGK